MKDRCIFIKKDVLNAFIDGIECWKFNGFIHSSLISVNSFIAYIWCVGKSSHSAKLIYWIFTWFWEDME